MKRRSILVALCGGLSAVAGCSTAPAGQAGTTATASPPGETTARDRQACADDSQWEPTVAVDDVELAPGESTVFAVRASPITSFNFDGDLYSCGQDDEPVQFGDVDIDPDPDRQADSCPPYWIWDECTSVELRVPVEAAPDADPGEYEYGFSISGGTGGSVPSNEYTIVVSDS